MGMMNVIRERMHIVLWILVILFLGSMTVGGLVGGADIIDQIFGKVDPSKAIASINGENIDPSTFFNYVNYRIEQNRSQGIETDDRQLDQLRNSILDDLINQTLLKQEILDRDITVSDDEIFYDLENNPPYELQQNTSFQTNGIFDTTKYIQALHNPQGDEWIGIEEYVRETLLQKKLREEIDAAVYVSMDEVKRDYVKQNTDFTVSGISFRYGTLKDVPDPKDDELLRYYDEHKEDYKQEEQRGFSYVSWNKEATKVDTQQVYDEAKEILKSLQKGDDFAILANEYSDDPGNKDNGGDLGWFDRRRMVPQFSDAAFSAPLGKAIGPILTPFGYHIILVKDKQTKDGVEQVLASHILLKIELGVEGKETLRRNAQHFSFDAEDIGFEKALEKNSLKATDIKPFPKDARFLPGVGYLPSSVRFAFDGKIGDVSDLLESDNAFIIIKINNVTAKGYRSFDDVKQSILTKVKNEVLSEKGKKIIDRTYEEIKKGKSFQELSKANADFKLIQNMNMKTAQISPEFGKSPMLTGALLSSKAGDLLPPLDISGGYAILKVEKISPFDNADWEVKKDSIRNRLLSMKKNQNFTDWLTQLKKNSKIIDNRNFFF